ncbi:MAG: NAD-dependent epimerase/dehydratase family protein [Xanthomonadaceae bacterium]|nr:NAD-dependent epimerase/dehydratase family protein [Xanthomonadaceae bacterium]
MMRIGITGSQGLLGWHLSCFLSTQKDVEIKRGHRAEFESSSALSDFVKSCDVIIHCAGMNRGDESLVAQTNIKLTEQLVSALKNSQVKQVLFANSTHIDRQTAYGESKRTSAKILGEWAKESHGVFTDIVFPGIFGEQGKPFYNSVVSTFCHQIANGEKTEVHQDSEIELIHASEASQIFWNAITNKTKEQLRPAGTKIRVTEVLVRITEFSKSYASNIVPDLRDDFDLYLFNTYRSYLFPKHYPVSLELKSDPRGTLFEAEKNKNGGQAFVSTTVPGITRGNHFHIRKIERFCVIQGQAKIQIRKLYSDQVHEFDVSGIKPQYIDMPTLHTHNITNTGKDTLLTLFWSGDIFDPKNTDTYSLVVQRTTGSA